MMILHKKLTHIPRLLTVFACLLMCEQTLASDAEHEMNTLIGKQNYINYDMGANNSTHINSMRFTGIELSTGIYLGQADIYDENNIGFISPQKEFFYGVENVGITVEKHF